MSKCSFEGCDKPIFVKATNKGPLCNGHYAQYKKGKELKPLRGYGRRQLTDSHGICPGKGCGRASWYKAGFCQSHKKRAKEDSEIFEDSIRGYEFQNGATCKVSGCTKPAKSRGYCASHYRQDWGRCKHPGCTRKMYNKRTGYCSSHYSRLERDTGSA